MQLLPKNKHPRFQQNLLQFAIEVQDAWVGSRKFVCEEIVKYEVIFNWQLKVWVGEGHGTGSAERYGIIVDR